jgi:nicotinamide-nucleotide amidase
VNTNAAWIGKQLFGIGWRVSRQTVVPDGTAIAEAMREAAKRTRMLIVTGGLGPTSDDVTRDALAELFQVRLMRDDDVARTIENYFHERGRTVAECNYQQAMVPEGAIVLPNPHGTAPGLWMPARPELGLPDTVLLPGPPRELMPMMSNYVLPKMAEMSADSTEMMRVFKVVGLGESDLHEVVDAPLTSIQGLELGYCARPGEVDVRLIGSADVLDQAEKCLFDLVGGSIVSSSGEGVEEHLVHLLAERHQTIATAESCTGGLIARRITDIPGASSVFHYGWVTYANEAKESQLGVPATMLDELGAVSEPVARAMAEGARERANADWAVSVTGLAGPGGGTPETPVGTVCIAWARRDGETVVTTMHRPNGRELFRDFVAKQALVGVLRLMGEVQ